MKHLIYQMCVGITYLFLSYWWQSNTQIWRWVRGSSSCFEICWPVERCSYWCTNDYSAIKEEKPNNFLIKLVWGAIYIVQCPLFFEYTFLCLVLCIEVEKNSWSFLSIEMWSQIYNQNNTFEIQLIFWR